MGDDHVKARAEKLFFIPIVRKLDEVDGARRGPKNKGLLQNLIEAASNQDKWQEACELRNKVLQKFNEILQLLRNGTQYLTEQGTDNPLLDYGEKRIEEVQRVIAQCEPYFTQDIELHSKFLSIQASIINVWRSA